MDSGSIPSVFSSEKFKGRSRAPLREVGSTVYIPPLRSSSMPNSLSRKSSGDRFIPDRSAMDMDYARYQLTEPTKEKENDAVVSPAKEAYRKLLAETCLNNRNRILAFRSKPPTPTPTSAFLPEPTSSNQAKPAKPKRYISQTAERTLDAPDIMDDYYLNLLDWGSGNVLSVALANTVYLWNASEGYTSELVTVQEELGPVTSVSWAPDGQHIQINHPNIPSS